MRLRRMPMHLSLSQVTLMPGKFSPPPLYPPPNFPQSDLGRRADSRWALPQISSFFLILPVLLVPSGVIMIDNKWKRLWWSDDGVCDGRYGSGTLTGVFIDRVFQECLTYDGEMDYKTYLDFVLAIENRKEPPSLQYMFRLLDVQNKGYLNIFDLNYFFRVTILWIVIIVFKNF